MVSKPFVENYIFSFYFRLSLSLSSLSLFSLFYVVRLIWIKKFLDIKVRSLSIYNVDTLFLSYDIISTVSLLYLLENLWCLYCRLYFGSSFTYLLFYVF